MVTKGTMEHAIMHNSKREPQQTGDQFTDQTLFPSARISAPGPGGSTAPSASLTFDVGTQSALTTIVQTVEQTITQPATTLTTTFQRTISVVDSAQYSSLQASESSKNAEATASATESSPASAATSSAAAKSSSSNNLSTLIPAIVVPVVAVLIISFVVFWLIMRRRAQRQMKDEPDFVMAKQVEKPISRGDSKSSGHSSTRELVPMSNLEKEVAVSVAEAPKSSLDLFPPRYHTTDIGLARPMTPPDKAGMNADGTPKRTVPNFSSVRPSTSNRPRTGQERSYGPRSRGQSGSLAHAVPAPRPTASHGPSKSSRGPAPPLRGQMALPPPRPVRPDERGIRPGAESPRRGAVSPFNTHMAAGNRAAPPKPLNSPTPTGAFNGASPISQYSPIVKGVQNLDAVAGANGNERRQPSPLSTMNLRTSGGKDSPVDENVLSKENMRIARLANSSRLGSNQSPSDAQFPLRSDGDSRALSPLKEGQPVSTRLPPALRGEELPRKPFARGPDSPAGASSIYPSPSIGAGATPQIGGGYSTTSLPYTDHNTIGVASSGGMPKRLSVVSQISSDDGYVDMEFDAKSDISPWDEREKWEVETETRSRTGYAGSVYDSPIEGPAGPSSASTGVSKPNLRDRDSEGPFVLSRY